MSSEVAGGQRLAFAKGHGTGNDFVLLPDPEDRLELTAALARGLCDRRTGLGADGVLRVAPGPDGGWFMDHRNADGTHAEMCGNGIRLFGRYLVDAGLAAPGRHRVLTRAGIRSVDVPGHGDVSVDMGPPAGDGPERAVLAHGSVEALRGTPVNMGNPHVVARVDDRAALSALDLTVAPAVEPAFAHGVNAEFVVLTGERALELRVHERGVGETASCGTGACAAAVAAAAWERVDGPWEWSVTVPGGRLVIAWTGETIVMTGPATLLASGEVDTSLLA